MAKEKNLTAVTSVAAADFARVVTSAGASVKATFANVAKYIVETYNGSTVAGSAQSVKSALDSLNSNLDGCKAQFLTFEGGSVTLPAISLVGILVVNSVQNGGIYVMNPVRCINVCGNDIITSDGTASGQTITAKYAGTFRMMLIYK